MRGRNIQMKHAYIITAHNNFSVLKKLLEWLDDERNTIYLHLDAKSKDISVKEFTFLKHARIKAIPRIPLYWAGSSIVEAVLALMEASLAEDYDYCHYLTGADVMLKGLDELDAFLEKHYGMEFINFIPRAYDLAKYKANIIIGLLIIHIMYDISQFVMSTMGWQGFKNCCRLKEEKMRFIILVQHIIL